MGSTFGNREFSPPTSCWIKQSKGTLTFHSIGWCMKMLLRVYVYHNPYIPGESKTPLYPKTTRVIFSQLNLLKPFKVSEKTHHRESSLVFQCFCSTLAMHQPVISPCLVLLKQPPNGGPQKVWKWNPSKGNVKREPKTTLVKSEGLSLKKTHPSRNHLGCLITGFISWLRRIHHIYLLYLDPRRETTKADTVSWLRNPQLRTAKFVSMTMYDNTIFSLVGPWSFKSW